MRIDFFGTLIVLKMRIAHGRKYFLRYGRKQASKQGQKKHPRDTTPCRGPVLTPTDRPPLGGSYVQLKTALFLFLIIYHFIFETLIFKSIFYLCSLTGISFMTSFAFETNDFLKSGNLEMNEFLKTRNLVRSPTYIHSVLSLQKNSHSTKNPCKIIFCTKELSRDCLMCIYYCTYVQTWE